MSPPLRQRRTHSKAFKAMLVAQCQQPGVSIAAVAMAHQINDNLLRAWLRKAAPAEERGTVGDTIASPPRIVPVQVATVVAPSASSIRIHIQHGSTQIHVEWPVANAALCGEWLQAWLR